MSSTDLLEIDTKGLCLLCLNPCPKPSDNHSTCVQGFKKLLRYLNVNTTQLFNCSVQLLQSMEVSEDVDVGISLCFGCAQVTQKFDVLYKQYEVIRLQLDDCVQSVEQSIKDGDGCSTRVREYKERMKPRQRNDLFNTSFAANLRSETLQKCSSKLATCSPRVSISKVDCLSKSTPNVTADASSPPTVKLRSPLTSSNKPSTPASKPSIPNVNNITLLSKPLLNSSSTITMGLSLLLPTNTSYQLSTPAVTRQDNDDTAIPIRIESKSVSSDADKNDDSDDSSDIEVLSIIPIKKPAGIGGTVNSVSADDPNSRSSPADMVPCSECSASIQRSLLRSHQMTQHPELFLRDHFPPDLTPSLCQNALNLLLSQLETVGTGFKCPYCSTSIETQAEMRTHVITLHTIILAQQIVRYFKGTLGVTRPPEEEGGMVEEDIICEIVNLDDPIEFESNESEPVPSTSTHPPPVVDNNTVSDVVCNTQVSFPALLDNQVERQSSDNVKPEDAKCDICGKVYPSIDQLNRHVKRYHCEKTFACTYCDYSTITNHCLKLHMFTRHLMSMIMKGVPGRREEEVEAVVNELLELIIKPGNNQCSYCNIKTTRLSGLRIHFFTYHLEKFVQKVREVLEGKQGQMN